MVDQQPNQTESTPSIRRVALASAVGCTIEWYDFFLYGTAAPLVFTRLFFPTFDPFVGVLVAYTSHAVGFVARPIGGVIFGHFGDRFGRKNMLVLTLIIMGVATFLIGLLPTYDTIGIWAPILLCVLRVFQGLGVGGEWGGAVLLAVEHSPSGRRGFYGSWPQMGVPAGLCLATGAIASVSMLPEDQFLTWGWRIAFLASALLVGVGMYIRLKVLETPAFVKVQHAQAHARIPFIDLLRTHPRNVLLGMGQRYIEGLSFNIYGVFSIYYLTTVLELPRSSALLGIMASAIIMIFCLPAAGLLSDRFGRRAVFGTGSVLTGLLAFPAFWVMSRADNVVWIWLAIAVPFGVVYPLVYGPLAALFSELFDTRVRYSGISFVYQFSGIFASGLTPAIATALLGAADNEPWLVASYLVGISILSTACIYAVDETAHRDIAEDVHARRAPQYERHPARTPQPSPGVGEGVPR